jgi:hypothetical protein
MTSDRSDYVIDFERPLGDENASRFDGHENGASVSCGARLSSCTGWR